MLRIAFDRRLLAMKGVVRSTRQTTTLLLRRVKGVSARAVSSAAATQLKMFPEFTDAKELEAIGNFKRAQPLYQRMHDVLSGAIGKASAVSVELACHNARLCAMQGDHARSIKILKDGLSSADSKQSLVRYHSSLAEMYLLSGDSEEAYNSANRAKDAVEEHSDHEGDDELALFSPIYGLLGVCSLYHGDLDHAETYLQLAARWAQQQHPQLQITALANLGAFSLFKIGTPEYPCAEQFAAAEHGLPQLRLQVNSVAASVNYKALHEHPLVKEATAYWNEALEVVTLASRAPKTSAAGAMCGVSNTAVPDMTGLGGKARTVPSSTSTEASSEAGAEDSSAAVTAESLLNDTACMNAYVGVLSNFAELYECTGALAEKEDYLSSALSALQTYEQQLTDTTSGSAGSGLSAISKVAHRPVLGRVLALAAHREMSLGQAVTAEGLYRSALEHLESPVAANDPRWKYERGVAMTGYGLLLSKWDKRAAAGEDMAQQGRWLTSSTSSVILPSAKEGDKRQITIPLSGMIQLPILV